MPNQPPSRSLPEIDLSSLNTYPICERRSKVSVEDFATPLAPGASVADLLSSLPRILAGNTFREAVAALAEAVRLRRAVVLTMGAHVIKCGLAPILIDLMRRGYLSAVAIHGAGAIHDLEIALFGATSEDVESELPLGRFGMARDTAEFFNAAASEAAAARIGLGAALGARLLKAEAPHAEVSLLAQAAALGVPITVHVALGTDIVHMHPSADGAALGDASLRDFRILANVLRGISHGGAVVNVGSAVVLPEVLLKCFSLLRNLGHDLSGCTGINLDFIQQYRSGTQVVRRLELLGGRGMALTGHHELLVPLLAWAWTTEVEIRRGDE
ncbi:MAG TPA: hypothetical protein GX715_15700 [Armatimonadetes bacterium]|jgi:hypothetical protein|nr:hypothetical protein [Armatimonadota bacterium]